jgi:hypothetical protein
MKRLDQNPSNLLNGSTSPKDFIIADAKDANMTFGVTPSAQANDTSDVWEVRGRKYPTEHPPQSFRSAKLDHIKYDYLTDSHDSRRPVRPQDQSIRKPARLHRVPAPRGGWGNLPDRRGKGLSRCAAENRHQAAASSPTGHAAYN